MNRLGEISRSILGGHTRDIGRSMSKISSGSRIGRAADDAAGLAIAEKFTARERGMQQAVRNASDGVSMLQIGEGAMSEVSDMLVRLREVAVAGANGTLGDSERATLNKEAQDIIGEIDRISAVTEFDGIKLLDGSSGSVQLQTGPDAGDTLAVAGVDVRASQLGGASVLTDIDMTSQGGAAAAIDIVDQAIDGVTQARASLGVSQTRVESQIRSLQVSVENTAAARSRIGDSDMAMDVASLARSQILQKFDVAMQAQANQQQHLVMTLLLKGIGRS